MRGKERGREKDCEKKVEREGERHRGKNRGSEEEDRVMNPLLDGCYWISHLRNVCLPCLLQQTISHSDDFYFVLMLSSITLIQGDLD